MIEAEVAVPVPDSRALGMLDDLRSIFRPEIRVDSPSVIVNVPQQQAPQVIVNVPAPDVTVNMPTTPVQLTITEEKTPKKIELERDPKGNLKGATVKDA